MQLQFVILVKRIIAFIFLVIVNIILLAHAVFPHHHHNYQVCLLNSHCNDDSKAHKHNTDEHNHDHDGNNKTQNCLLKQAVIIPSNSLKDQVKCTDYSRSNNNLQFILFYSETSSSTIYPVSISNRKPVFKSEYSFLINHSLGLRAPPIA